MTRFSSFCVSVVLSLACLQSGQAKDYTFTNIADTTGSYFSFNTPAINADGAVAFRAELDTFHSGIYVSDGTGVTTIAHNDGTSFQGFVFQTPGIDAAGTVYFSANRVGSAGGGNGIFSGNGGLVTTYALNTSPVGITSFGRPSVSGNGQIAFRASHVEIPAGQGRAGVFSGLDLLESSSGAFMDFGNGNAEIAVNNLGVVAFTGSLDSGVSGVFIDTVTGSSPGTIADTTGLFSNFIHSSPSINSEGVVAFHASLDAGGEGIFLGSGTEAAVPLVTSTAPFTSFAPVTSINSSGIVAFTAATTLGNGLFTGPDHVADRVSIAGQPLFGSTVTAHSISNASLNDAGQIAFRYTLANGINGIALATPVANPSSGDFDEDGDVDGYDFLMWQRGQSPDPLSATDLSDWQENYGGPALAAASVPEPSSLVAVAYCLLAGVCGKRSGGPAAK